MIDLLVEHIRSTPNLSNKTMRKLLHGYTTEYAITNNLLQKKWSEGKAVIFGIPSLNVQYCHVLKQEMEAHGNPVELHFLNHTQITMALSTSVADNENRRLKKERKNIMKRDKRAAGKWFTENKDFLDSQMGLANATQFLSGILFTTLASIQTVPHLQRLIQADTAHMQFGKCKLFSAYGTAAEGSISPVAFAIMFGNENKESWGHFWHFAVKHHPLLNNALVTLITDQDKGLIHAIKEYVDSSHHFHCSWHRKGNIMKLCSGGKKVNSGWWYLNQLVNCNTVEEIEVLHNKHLAKIATKMLWYINNVPDTAQYPAARCAMSLNIYMYGWSESSGNELMNRANQRA